MTNAQPEKTYLLGGLSLLLAVLIFLFITGETTGEKRMIVPLEYEGVPEGLTLVIPPPARLDVVAAGPRILLFKARLTGLKLRLDLHGLHAGRNSFSEPGQFILSDHDLRVKRVMPAVDIIAQISHLKKPD